MHDLILEYKKGKKALERMRDNATDPEDRKIINEMIYDMEFAIKWMELGHRPDYVGKGIEQKGAYKRRVLLNMDMFPSLDFESEEIELSEERKEIIRKIMLLLSQKQLNCYLLYYAYSLSMQEIADEMGISKATVQEHINKARRKAKEVLKLYYNNKTEHMYPYKNPTNPPY